jgi:hypothetical protein
MVSANHPQAPSATHPRPKGKHTPSRVWALSLACCHPESDRRHRRILIAHYGYESISLDMLPLTTGEPPPLTAHTHDTRHRRRLAHTHT